MDHHVPCLGHLEKHQRSAIIIYATQLQIKKQQKICVSLCVCVCVWRKENKRTAAYTCVQKKKDRKREKQHQPSFDNERQKAANSREKEKHLWYITISVCVWTQQSDIPPQKKIDAIDSTETTAVCSSL